MNIVLGATWQAIGGVQQREKAICFYEVILVPPGRKNQQWKARSKETWVVRLEKDRTMVRNRIQD